MKKSKKVEKTKPVTTNVCNNAITGVHWDANAIESVSMVAAGLLNLTKLFCTQNIQIETMLKINPDLPQVINKKTTKKTTKK